MIDFSIVNRRPAIWKRNSKWRPVIEAILQTYGTEQSVLVPYNGKTPHQTRELIRTCSHTRIPREQRLRTQVSDDGVYAWLEDR